MSQELQAFAHATQLGNSLPILTLLIQIIGLACFAYIVYKRIAPMVHAQRDFRLDRPWLHIQRVVKFWFGQWKHPRYGLAGTLHLLIFAGFLILATRAFYLQFIFGLSDDFTAPSAVGRMYAVVADYAATIVFLSVAFAAVRRVVFKPERYAVPERYGKGHPVDAVFLLGLIALLMFLERWSARPCESVCGPIPVAWRSASARTVQTGLSSVTITSRTLYRHDA